MVEGRDKHKDEHHIWKCMPKHNTTSPSPSPKPSSPSPSPSPKVSPSPSPSPSPATKCEIQPWGQCGGNGGDCGCGKPGYECKDTPYKNCTCTTDYECRREVSEQDYHSGSSTVLITRLSYWLFQNWMATSLMTRCCNTTSSRLDAPNATLFTCVHST